MPRQATKPTPAGAQPVPVPPTPAVVQQVSRFSNQLPTWLNVILVSAIFATGLYGAMRFLDHMNTYDPALGIHNFRLFFPALISMLIYTILLFVNSLFGAHDLATIMCVILVFVGFCVLMVGVFSDNEHTRVKFFEVASAVLGLGLGIPFGEKLRSEEKR